ncbi:RNA polymerase sigma factor SigZ [Cohnella soli]|uniref:RNA polymerase sigma factor n=1 Tax=Cohnella soli TaxID=425005 RepID=A0ABW0HWY7_9BACL
MEFAQLWEQYFDEIRRFVYRKTNSHPDADDIVQTVFMKAYNHQSDLNDEDKKRAWLYQIARNSITDHFRKTKRTEELTEFIPDDQEPEEVNYSEEALEGLKSVITQLPGKYREAIELSELTGMSQKELGEHLDISYSGAKSRVQRGREMIKEIMTTCCQIEADSYGNIVDYQVIGEEAVCTKGNKKATSGRTSNL